MFPTDVSPADLGWVFAGFLLVASLVLLATRKKKNLKVTRYVTEVPAKMIIEEESSS